MTDEQKLKRDPATILRKAVTHLRKNYESSRSSAGKETLRQLKLAGTKVEQERFIEQVNALRSARSIQ